MTNNLDETVQRYHSQQINQKPKSTKNQLLTYILIGVGIVIAIFTVVEVISSPRTKEPELNQQAQLEQKALELDATIEQAEKDKQVAELRKQSTALELEAYKLSTDYE
jgi:flagellar biosynthesis/type III secretory pathway M-ring protein FliF/YscJ